MPWQSERLSSFDGQQAGQTVELNDQFLLMHDIRQDLAPQWRIFLTGVVSLRLLASVLRL